MPCTDVSFHLGLVHTNILTDATAEREHPLLFVYMKRHMTDKLSVKLCLKAADVAAVVVGAVFELWAFIGNSGNNLLGVCVHQFDRVDGEVLVEVGSALSRVRT